MLVCNFMESDLFGNKYSVSFSKDAMKGVCEGDLYQVGTSLLVGTKEESERGRFKDAELVDLLHGLVGDAKSTDSNPVIFIATKGFKVGNVPSHIRYIPVRGGVILALIQGFITVIDTNGDEVPLARNCGSEGFGDGLMFNSLDIMKLNVLQDKESDVAYNDYVISDCVIAVSAVGGDTLKSTRFNSDGFTFLDKEIFSKGKVEKEKREEALRIEREEKAKNKSFVFSAPDEEVIKQTKKEKSNKKKADVTVEKTSTGSSGAKSFLDFVATLG